MKKAFILIAAALFNIAGFAQKVAKITLGPMGEMETLSVATDDGVIINLSDDGMLLLFGVEPFNTRTAGYGDFTDRLDPYMGRVEFFTANDNEAFRGKVRYIGKTPITYFASYDEESLRGKVKSIGAILIGYYQASEDKAFAGKIKNIGSTVFSYYSSFDNEGFRGKIRSVGLTKLTYYTTYDDKIFGGKIKSIGNFNYTYYSSFDRIEFRGARKSGQPIQYINGVKFYVK